MTPTAIIRLQDAALDLANLALVPDVPARQWEAAVERYRLAKLAHNSEGN